MIHLDTSYLIDLLRETTRDRPGPALEFIEGLDANESLAVSVHVVCELRAGAELSKSPLREHEEVDRTAASLDDAPVVTRNVKDFSRVPGLRLLTY